MPHSKSKKKEEIAPRGPAWFWWALVNLLALCFAVTSWTLTLEIFGRPDVPTNYEILRKLERAPGFKSFSAQAAPEGRVLSPSGLYAWFFDMGDKRHALLNSLYRRNYMRNFDDAHAVTYVEGDFQVLATRVFNENDFIPNGFAIRAKAMVKPDDFSAAAPYPVILELMLPGAGPEALERFPKGATFSLEKAAHLPVILHVQRHLENDEPVVQVTVMPICIGMLQQSGGRVAFEPPEWVRPEGKLPLFKNGAGAQ